MELRFVADAMLGRLAKWLRILGYDTLYRMDAVRDGFWDRAHLVRLARAEERILLTRDREMAHRRGVRVLLLESEGLEEQLAQLRRDVHLATLAPFSRCPVCNEPLEAISRDQAWGQVPPYIFATQPEFRLCPSCSRFYWRGSHWERMLALLSSWDRTGKA